MTNTTTKLTKVQKFEMLANIPAVAENEILAQFVAREIELLKSKKSSERKPSKTQEANAVLQAEILEAMTEGRAYSVGELIKEVPACMGLSSQKVTAVIRLLIPTQIEKIVDKRQFKYRKVVTE
jgi:hypothetical protein